MLMHIVTSPSSSVNNGAAGLVLRQHSPLPPAYKQPSGYVLGPSLSFKIALPESFISLESEPGKLFQNELIVPTQHWNSCGSFKARCCGTE
jgi:hypothetical protein